MASSGTQSPPLENTGSDKPMGVSSIDGTKYSHVSDREQRKEYFGDDTDQSKSGSKEVAGETKAKPVGQSLQQSVEERT